MIRHCDGECGKHDCYVGFLEARLTEVERERDEARAEVERLREGVECHVARPGEGTYECRVERKCPACRLRHAEAEVERLQADLDVVDSDLSLAVKRLTADNNRLYDEKAKLRKALEGLLKTSAPHAQWTAAEHEAQIVLEQTGKKL